MRKFFPPVAIFVLLALLFVIVAPLIVNAQSYTWVSYNDPRRRAEDQDETFSGAEDTVYMRGDNFTAYNIYKVGYYDASDQRVATDTVVSDTSTLDSDYYFPNDETAVADTWHSVVFNTTGAIPGTYTSTLATDYPAIYVVEDSFTVEASAIPEFPTVIAMIVAMGLSFGIYYWMRKRYYRHAAVALPQGDE